ncbi:hypothetical protein EYE40_05405 [Glaciihabitans arcticus]|uniref:Lipoprotein n=1 Tax=Glaciihabitans arcticus TaxID=2668039 RepID=A0A4Q9GPU9_9MICO|nr:hypothetical protein [Glaciihabitans arcticus]TBN56882.1 hypothetical protein EYE40_05405 [Glaciihabitans arcticus]
MTSSLARPLVLVAASLLVLTGCTATAAPTGGATPKETTTPETAETITLAEGCEEFGIAFEQYSKQVVDAEGNTTLPQLSEGTKTLAAAAATIAPRLGSADAEAAEAFTKVVDAASVLILELDSTKDTVETYNFEGDVPAAYSASMQELTDVCVPE